MAKQYAIAFYHSKAWYRCRQSYIGQRVLIDGGLCESCKEEPGYMVHHKIMLTEQNINDPEIALNFSNLQYLCKACHDAEEGHWLDAKGYKKPKSAFDSNGNPIDLRKL